MDRRRFLQLAATAGLGAVATPSDLFAQYRFLDPVRVRPGWLDRRRVRVACAACGEGINYEREVAEGDRVLCRACGGERYYAAYDPAHTTVELHHG